MKLFQNRKLIKIAFIINLKLNREEGRYENTKEKFSNIPFVCRIFTTIFFQSIDLLIFLNNTLCVQHL